MVSAKTKTTEQGSILRISGISVPVIVVSKNFFNDTGHVIVCPIFKNAAPGALHIEIHTSQVDGYVICEQVKYIDLSARRFSILTNADAFDIMNISDAVMGIFDYI